MAGSLQRLEILLVGGLMLLIGALGAGALVIRPPAQQAYAPAPAISLHALPAPEQDRDAPRTIATPATSDGAPLALPAVPTVLVALARATWPPALLATGLGGLVFVGLRITRRRPRRVGLVATTLRALAGAALRQVTRVRAATIRLTSTRRLAARLTRVWRRATLLPTKLPRLARSRLALPPIRRAHRSQLHITSTAHAPVAATPVDAPAPSRRLEPLTHVRPSAALSGLCDLPEHSDPGTARRGAGAPAWTPEDRALAAAAALGALWEARGLTSPLLAVDTPTRTGVGQVTLAIDALPGEERRLSDVPEMLAADRPGWRARWVSRPDGPARLVVDGCGSGSPPARGPLLAPVLTHGRAGGTLRLLPLRTWRHLALYGTDALSALHALLVSLLYTQSPHDLALVICDTGQIAPLYRGVAHQVAAPGDGAATLGAALLAVRPGTADMAVRPAVIVLVEPDRATLGALASLLNRLRQHPDAPLHVIVAQSQPSAAGREVYGLLPALLSGGGPGQAAGLPGQPAWPRQGAAQLIARGMRLSGRAVLLSEAEVALALAPLRTAATGLPPIRWEVEAAARKPRSPRAIARPDAAPAPQAVRPARHADAQGDERAWPTGPGGMRGGALAALFEALLAAPAIESGTRPGITSARLAPLLHPQLQRHAATLVCWMDAAGVLAAPSRPDLRWREPRALISRDRAWVAGRLAATPLPDDDVVRLATDAVDSGTGEARGGRAE